MSILVTGGAGYIGSHCVQQLLNASATDVVVYDNLSTGHAEFLLTDKFVRGDIQDKTLLVETLRKYGVDTVMHFAASSYVGESVTDPGKYYRNNVYGTLCLLEAMQEAGVNRLIFSSSCAVYGVPVQLPLVEDHIMDPVSPYGFSKRVIESMLKDFSDAYGLRYVSLRYFNAAGADPGLRLGEWHEPETHLIPLVLKAIAGERDNVTVLGTDYPTKDGTCIRDYIHINDIAAAHLQAMDYLNQGGASVFLNLGTETGHTVREVIAACERVTGRKAPVVEGPRRAGDPPVLVASADKIRAVLGWKPAYEALDDIVKTAWAWEQSVQSKRQPASASA